MNAKISVFVICVEAIVYMLLYNLHDCNFKFEKSFVYISLVLFARRNISISNNIPVIIFLFFTLQIFL